MRITPTQRTVILEAVRSVDPDARVLLFGSRANPHVKGGDIDLFITSDRIRMTDEWRIRRTILDQIGWQKLDLVVKRRDQLDSPIARIAQATGVAL